MTTELHDFYLNLEPNHGVEVDEDGYQVVVCPFVDEHAQPFRTSWSPNANPDEVNCLFCEYLNGAVQHAGPPATAHGGAGDDELPPILGGAHGGRHHTSEYQPCKVPLRRISWCRTGQVVHEGIVSDLGHIEDVWEAHNGPAVYPIRQADTGFYVCRKTVSGSSWSKHSYGCAGDINWKTNPYRTRRCDHPAWLIAAFKARGFGHGLDWSSTQDPMHYSKFPNEGGDGWLYAGAAADLQEDQMSALYQLAGSDAVYVTDGIFRQVLETNVLDTYRQFCKDIGVASRAFHDTLVEADLINGKLDTILAQTR